MALNEQRIFLIAYDIANPRRLARVNRYVKSVATPAQKSLYVAHTTANEVRAIRDVLAGLIDHHKDDVRIYPLPHRTRIWYYGKKPLPEGLLLVHESGLPDPLRPTCKE
jgi:CRISPR-associated protein Cas2